MAFLGLDVPSLLIVSSFQVKVRDMQLFFFLLEHLVVIVGLLIGLISKLSQGIGCPEERERDRCSSQNTHHLWVKFAVLYGHRLGCPRTITSKIADHKSL